MAEHKINDFLSKLKAGIGFKDAYTQAGITESTAKSAHRKMEKGLIKPGKDRLVLQKSTVTKKEETKKDE